MTRPLAILDNCDDCGACCRHIPAPPFVITASRDETLEKGLPADLREALLPVWEVRLLVAEAACPWFDAERRQCRHYDLRPEACREFEINSPSCRESRRKWGVESQTGE